MNLNQYAAALATSAALKLTNLLHLRALILLHEAHQLPLHAIARHLGTSTANMTGVADALTKLGYVRREFGTADRRVVFLAITLAGRVQLEKIAQADLAVA